MFGTNFFLVSCVRMLGLRLYLTVVEFRVKDLTFGSTRTLSFGLSIFVIGFAKEVFGIVVDLFHGSY